MGYFGDIQHWDGEQWTAQQGGSSQHLDDVWATPDGEVWVGGWNTLLRLRR